MTDEVFNLMKYFPNSYIKANKELILEEKGNVYFSLDRVNDKFDLCLKVVQYVSRSACKAQPYRDECQNLMYRNKIRDAINKFLGTNFDEEEMLLIYTKLGNGCNERLASMFVATGFDMDYLGKGNKK